MAMSESCDALCSIGVGAFLGAVFVITGGVFHLLLRLSMCAGRLVSHLVAGGSIRSFLFGWSPDVRAPLWVAIAQAYWWRQRQRALVARDVAEEHLDRLQRRIRYGGGAS